MNATEYLDNLKAKHGEQFHQAVIIATQGIALLTSIKLTPMGDEVRDAIAKTAIDYLSHTMAYITTIGELDNYAVMKASERVAELFAKEGGEPGSSLH